jgi:hypothetical protein
MRKHVDVCCVDKNGAKAKASAGGRWRRRSRPERANAVVARMRIELLSVAAFQMTWTAMSSSGTM